jgi:fibronectin type 3 domain-containing protein
MGFKKPRVTFFKRLLIILLAFPVLNLGFYQRVSADTEVGHNIYQGVRNTDVNGDGKVDFSDLSEVKNNYGVRSSDSSWREKYDINYDSIVDIYDIVLVSRDIGRVISTPPAAPTTLTAAAESSSQIRVSWGAVQSVENYNVYRASSYSGVYTKVGNTANTLFIDNGLIPNTTYYYKIASVNPNGEGPMSDSISATTLPAAPKPKAPNFILQSITIDGFVTFFRPATLETITPTGYRFYIGESMNGPWELAAEGNGYTNIFTITYPIGSTQYIKFTALNDTTESDPQGPYYLAVLPKPSNIRYYTHGAVGQIGSYGWIDLRWNATPGATKYYVYYKDAYDINAQYAYAGTVTSTQINIYNIPYYKAFRYRIVPVNYDGKEGSLYGEIVASVLGEGGPYGTVKKLEE